MSVYGCMYVCDLDRPIEPLHFFACMRFPGVACICVALYK